MAPPAYVAEDGLVVHQWEERPLVLRRLEMRVASERGSEWTIKTAFSGFTESMVIC